LGYYYRETRKSNASEIMDITGWKCMNIGINLTAGEKVESFAKRDVIYPHKNLQLPFHLKCRWPLPPGKRFR